MGGAEWSPLVWQLRVFAASLLCGFVLALAGISRHERMSVLAWIALFLNGLPLIYLFVTWS